jgi:cytochrome o ubiquinol oxidase subunit 2
MGRKIKITLGVLFALVVLLGSVWYVCTLDIAVLNPKGWIGMRQRDLLVTATLLMLVIVVPVFVLTCYIAWKYRASNKKAEYKPDWDNNHLFETIWWGFPFAIVLVLSIITWKSCHELDPYKPLVSDVKPLKIQVVALDWKWLFIYPEQKIATVNFVQFPVAVPLNFEITSDAPMNSFWIPQLGGQVYAMSGMRSKLHLIADHRGDFRGSSANISGKGFAGMTFVAKVSSQAEFDEWVQGVKQSSNSLGLEEYNKLAMPTIDHPVESYVLKGENLFDWVVMKYMAPQ